ncbi:hypothetical protein Ngar_c15490 [Candidatus Nitrososphaera gargensis Ga9.2]|uniref:DOT1 domain-containing protein n=1 Tax=Nitrososphaera gargensis (strain Ga9.2) TaxID=1237085 RepID=K0IHR0_NITGG|nr:hypothetical protein [Candidatus Nitrososphaera gargensis]AFU58483.1 hypothetical protein Ngar_c15490 [Candidatus Nitrososphaera gargensis Ga9.2]
MDNSIPRLIIKLKNEFVRTYRGQSLLREVLPLPNSRYLPVDDDVLHSLHQFAAANLIYFRSYDSEISGIACKVYEGDINNYWLNSKKYDTSYQPFYPTWILSAFALAHGAKSLGFEQLVDVGSGDGRIAYCGRLLGMESHGIEIDYDLVQLQNSISAATGIRYSAIRADATRFDYKTLKLSKPIFFISGLPEMGEMLANSVISQAKSIEGLMHNSAGFNFMGSHVMKSFSRDQTGWGWGSVIANHDLELVDTVTLPTLWTTDQVVDTAYVYTRFKKP